MLRLNMTFIWMLFLQYIVHHSGAAEIEAPDPVVGYGPTVGRQVTYDSVEGMRQPNNETLFFLKSNLFCCRPKPPFLF